MNGLIKIQTRFLPGSMTYQARALVGGKWSYACTCTGGEHLAAKRLRDKWYGAQYRLWRTNPNIPEFSRRFYPDTYPGTDEELVSLLAEGITFVLEPKGGQS